MYEIELSGDRGSGRSTMLYAAALGIASQENTNVVYVDLFPNVPTQSVRLQSFPFSLYCKQFKNRIEFDNGSKIITFHTNRDDINSLRGFIPDLIVLDEVNVTDYPTLGTYIKAVRVMNPQLRIWRTTPQTAHE